MTTKKRIQITYNPFVEKKKTTILIDNKEPSEGSSLYKYQYLHLQSGLNNLFKDLHENSERLDYSVEFTGLEVDCEDMREAVDQAKEKGFDIDYKENIIKPNTTERLKELEQLLDELKENPILKEHIKDNQTFAQLTDNTFDIFVVATMSSGKSTFINAMLGSNLLPAANEATTATIAEITDNKSLNQGKYLISRTNQKGDLLDAIQELDLTHPENRSSNLLSTWNSDIDTQEDPDKKTGKINIEGNLIGIKLTNQQVKIKLSDTPGPNNSQNENHKIVTLGKIQDTKRNPLIIYVLNGNQMSVGDDDKFLKNIAKIMKEQGKLAQERFIFVINKMDDYFDDDENITNTLDRAKAYLAKHNIVNPKVFPISALFARLLRTNELNPNLLSASHYIRLNNYVQLIALSDDRDLSQYMELNPRVKARLKEVSNETLKRTGLPALEAYISDYIEKYNEVYRIMNITKAIRMVLQAAELSLNNTAALNGKSESELNELRTILADAQSKLKKSQEIRHFIEDLKDKQEGLSDKTAKFFTDTQKETFEPFIKSKQNSFQEKVSPQAAEYKIKEVRKELTELLVNFEVKLNEINKENQQETLDNLNNKYKAFVGDMFDELFKDKIEPTIKDNLKGLAFNVNQYLKLDKGYVKEESFTIERKRKLSLFEMIISLNFNGSVIEKSTGKREVFDFKKYWESASVKLTEYLDSSLKSIAKELEENAKDLTETYCSELHKRFDNKVTELLSTLEQTAKAEDLEKQIQDAEEKLELLREIESKLTSISSLEALEPQGE